MAFTIVNQQGSHFVSRRIQLCHAITMRVNQPREVDDNLDDLNMMIVVRRMSPKRSNSVTSDRTASLLFMSPKTQRNLKVDRQVDGCPGYFMHIGMQIGTSRQIKPNRWQPLLPKRIRNEWRFNWLTDFWWKWSMINESDLQMSHRSSAISRDQSLTVALFQSRSALNSRWMSWLAVSTVT